MTWPNEFDIILLSSVSLNATRMCFAADDGLGHPEGALKPDI
jgi:hypothetical protein